MTTMRLHRLATLILLCVICVLPLGKTHWMTSPLKNGIDDSKVASQTALQMHVSVFDQDKDGIIYIKETYQGLCAIGCNVAVAVAGSLFINGALSPMTKTPGSSSLGLPISIENICKEEYEAHFIINSLSR